MTGIGNRHRQPHFLHLEVEGFQIERLEARRVYVRDITRDRGLPRGQVRVVASTKREKMNWVHAFPREPVVLKWGIYLVRGWRLSSDSNFTLRQISIGQGS